VAHAVEEIIANGERLANRALEGLERINRRIEAMARHNPSLEYTSREIEQVFALAAAKHIGHYMTRER
jgi:hypothetical protein